MPCSGAMTVVGPSLSLSLVLIVVGPSLSLFFSFLAQTEETEVDAYEATLLAAAIGTLLLAAAIDTSLLL